MKIPDKYIYGLNEITKSAEKRDAGGLFLAYKQLLFIESMFEIFGIPTADENYDRLLRTKMHVDKLLIKKLAEFDKLQKAVDNYYASKP